MWWLILAVLLVLIAIALAVAADACADMLGTLCDILDNEP